MQVVPDSIQAWLLTCPELRPLLDPNSTEEEFDDALEVYIADAVRWLEDNANSLHKYDEDSLSTTLVGHISIRRLIEATRETNNKGHVDITIKVIASSRKRLGEAKIYSSYTYHEKGIKQLVDRYSTGRERTGYIFCYVKDPDIKSKISNLQIECNAQKPCRQTGNANPHSRWTFITLHEHTSGEELRVVHYGVNLHVATGGKRGSTP